MLDPSPRIVIVGGGPAGQAAFEYLPEARLIARPDATAWHAEPGRLWILRDGRVAEIGFDILLVAAPCPQLLFALGCGAHGWAPEVDADGRTSVPNVFAAGAVLGATTPEQAADHARIAACAILGLPSEGGIVPREPLAEPLPEGIACACLNVTEAALRATGATSAADAAAHFDLHAGECRMARCGPRLGEVVRIAPAVPVPLVALAAFSGEEPPVPGPRQLDAFLA